MYNSIRRMRPPSTNNTISHTKGSLGFDSRKIRQCRKTFAKCQTDWMGTRQEAYIQPQTQTHQTKAHKLNTSTTNAECGSHIHTQQAHTCTTQFAECGHQRSVTQREAWGLIAGRSDSAVKRSRNARRIGWGPGKRHTFNHRHKHIKQKHTNLIHPLQTPNAAHTFTHNKHTHVQLNSPNAATNDQSHKGKLGV